MNLTSLFNIPFLKENIKRSKATILLLIFLIPVINVIIYLMAATNSGVFMPTIMELEPLSIIGMYLMPVILSITLFSFIYKRKSSDFVMSFPISKKQIFMSNTLGGLLIILISNIVNYLFLLIATLLLNNVLIDYKMLFDLFLLWTVGYIFVFTCTTIAVAISSNKLTTIVVTLLVVFLIPFTHNFIVSDTFKGDTLYINQTYCNNDKCRPQNYECYDISCEINKNNDIYVDTFYHEVYEDTNYTLPYTLLFQGLFGIGNPNINKSTIKMFLLSIIYIIIGLILFMKRKFEVVETSFKNERLHIFVRSLTTVPILCVYYIILSNTSISFSDLFTIVFLFAIIITYIIIYDLLTRKKVTNIFKSLAALIIVGVIVVFTGEISKNKIEYIDVNKIEKMSFEDLTFSEIGNYTDNKDIINYIMSIHIENTGYKDYTRNMNVNIETEGKKYLFRISLTEEEYDYIIDKLNKDKTYQETGKKIKDNSIYAIQLDGDGSYVFKDSELYSKLIKEFKESNIIKEENSNYLFRIMIHTYSNFVSDTVYINIDDTSLMEEILNYYNEETKKAFKNPNIDIISYNLGVPSQDGTYDEQYFSSYNYDYQEVNKFIIDNLEEKVDITKPYLYIKMYISDRYKNAYVFATNKVEELYSIIADIKSKDKQVSFEKDYQYADVREYSSTEDGVTNG